MNNNILRQVKIFLVGGLISVILDWGFYLLLSQILNLDSRVSKAFSYIIGTVFAFIFNGIFAFKSKLIPSRLIRHLVLYTCTLFMNTYSFSVLERIIRVNSEYNLYFSLLGATFVSMMLNFLGMRLWVFKVYEIKNVNR